jgi:uncharacterized protein
MYQEATDLIVQDLGDSLIQESIGGNLPVVRQLIALGADINFANINGFTPLMAACQWKRRDVIKFILAKGASLTLVDYPTGRTALMHACLSGSAECVEILLQAGAAVRMKDSYGMTALMLAAMTGETEMVRHLVKAGAEMDVRANNGFTAMDWAEKWRRGNVVAYLLSTGRMGNHTTTGSEPEEHFPLMALE